MGVKLCLRYQGSNMGIVWEQVMKIIFRPKRNEMIGDWRKLHNEEPHSPYIWPSIIRIIESSEMRLARHVASVLEKECI
jgi:hypothetical protein